VASGFEAGEDADEAVAELGQGGVVAGSAGTEGVGSANIRWLLTRASCWL
jgi:hypothetical protein